MRILMLNNEFPPLGGGTGVVNYHILKELSSYQDVWVDLVTSSRSRRQYEHYQFADRINVYKIPVNNKIIHHASNRELILYALRGYIFSCQLLSQDDYDFCFAFSGIPAGFLSYILYITCGIPYFISLQGPDVPGFETRYNYIYPLLKPILRKVWGNSEKVIAISEEHKSLALETMPALDIKVIYNGVDNDVFFPNSRLRLGEYINILCVGRLIERKGQHHLIHVFKSLKKSINQPIHLTLVGTGDYETKLIKLAEELGISDSITFKGYVPREKMPEVYRQAHIFVLPSQSEGMSIALLEAMASGLPVIVTETGGTKELVEEMVNGLIVPWADKNALQMALIQLIESPSLRQQFQEENLKRIKAYGWTSITKQYLNMFYSLS